MSEKRPCGSTYCLGCVAVAAVPLTCVVGLAKSGDADLDVAVEPVAVGRMLECVDVAPPHAVTTKLSRIVASRI